MYKYYNMGAGEIVSIDNSPYTLTHGVRWLNTMKSSKTLRESPANTQKKQHIRLLEIKIDTFYFDSNQKTE